MTALVLVPRSELLEAASQHISETMERSPNEQAVLGVFAGLIIKAANWDATDRDDQEAAIRLAAYVMAGFVEYLLFRGHLQSPEQPVGRWLRRQSVRDIAAALADAAAFWRSLENWESPW